MDKDGPVKVEDTTGVELLIAKTMTMTLISLDLKRRREAKRLRTPCTVLVKERQKNLHC